MFQKKKFLGIIAVSIVVLGQFWTPSTVWGMENEEDTQLNAAYESIKQHSKLQKEQLEFEEKKTTQVLYWLDSPFHDLHYCTLQPKNNVGSCIINSFEPKVDKTIDKIRKLTYQNLQHNPWSTRSSNHDNLFTQTQDGSKLGKLDIPNDCEACRTAVRFIISEHTRQKSIN